MARPELHPMLARRFRTGRPCLDFIHTGGVGRWVAHELIHDPDDLVSWLAYLLDVDDVRALPADVRAAKRLRQSLWDMAQARVAGQPFDPADVETLNAAAAAPPPIPQMQ